MRESVSKTRLWHLGAVSLALLLPQAPARAGGDITNFKVENCTQERIFVCSFDKTDSLMKVPYKARGIQPGKKREFGCASIGRCKVIIGVSRKKSKKTLSNGVEAAMSTGAVVAAAGAGLAGGAYVFGGAGVAATIASSASLTAAGAAADLALISGVGAASTAMAVVSIGVGGAVAAIEIADGWSDGDVCKQVKKAARKANLKPKHFMQNNRNYKVIENYALDENGNPYMNADGTAIFTYQTKKGKSACPAPLTKQIIAN